MQKNNLELKQIIWQIVSLVPVSKVATYGQIANLSGYPSHSRYVGTVLKNLPAESALPWHRIINAQGAISFPHGSEKYNQQRSRLEVEGVIFTQSGRINLKLYQWQC